MIRLLSISVHLTYHVYLFHISVHIADPQVDFCTYIFIWVYIHYHGLAGSSQYGKNNLLSEVQKDSYPQHTSPYNRVEWPDTIDTCYYMKGVYIDIYMTE